MDTNQIKQNLLKLKDSFLEETEENKKMLDIYINYIEGNASNEDIENANKQLKQIFKSLGLGILVILPSVSYTHLTLPTTNSV